LSFHSKFHRKLVEYFFGVTIDDQGYSILGGDTPLITVEDLILTNFRSSGFVFYPGGSILYVDIREGMGAAFVPHQQGITLGEVDGIGCTLHHLNLASIGIL